ncbi:MAG: Cu(I)-responsive transcriptional regulator, partial [Asticcacaulis sp. 32-58-5]
LRRKITELEEMALALETLADGCAGDDRPDCPILKGMATGEDSPSRFRHRFGDLADRKAQM